MAELDLARGRRIRQFRKLAGLSQEELARAAGVKSSKAAYLWEKGYGLKPANLRAVAEALGRSVEELDGRAETPDPFQVAKHIDDGLQGIADEFRDYVAGIVAHMQEHDEMVRELLQRQTVVLARIEGLVASLPTEAGAREFVEALGAVAPPDGSAQPGHGEDAPATPFRPAAEEQ